MVVRTRTATLHGRCRLVGEKLKSNGIDFEVIHIGHKAIHGCIACGQCAVKRDGTCGIKSDILNETIPAIREADGLILASPVYYSGIAGYYEKLSGPLVFTFRGAMVTFSAIKWALHWLLCVVPEVRTRSTD